MRVLCYITDTTQYKITGENNILDTEIFVYFYLYNLGKMEPLGKRGRKNTEQNSGHDILTATTKGRLSLAFLCMEVDLDMFWYDF